MFVTIYNGVHPNNRDSDEMHTFKCEYVRNDGNSRYVLFDFVDDYKNIGKGDDMILGDGGKITIWLKYYKFTIEKHR